MSALTAYQRRDLHLIASLRALSFFGDAVALVTLLIRLAHHHGPSSGVAVAALTMANALPPVMLTPVAGLVVDRVRAKVLLPPITFFEGLVAIALGYFTNPWVTVGLVVLLGCGVAFTMPGYSALVPAIVGDDNVAAAQGTMQAYLGVAGVAGPAAGGLLVGLLGQHWPLYIDALTFFVCAIGTLMIRGDRVPVAPEGPREKGHLSVGVRWLLTEPVLRPVTLETLLFVLAIGVVNIASVFLIIRVMGASALLFGLVDAVYGVGNILGALVGGRIARVPMRAVRGLFGGAAIIGAAFAIVGVMPNAWFAMVPMAVGGLGNGIANVCAMTLFTTRTPEQLRGRVFAAVNAVITGTSMISMGIGGILLTFANPRWIYVGGGVLSLAAIIAFAPVAVRAAHRGHASMENPQGA